MGKGRLQWWSGKEGNEWEGEGKREEERRSGYSHM